jgi:hypothetical protein
MMKLLWTNLKHFSITSFVLLCLALGLAVVFSIDIDYGDDRRAYKVGGEGPHVFFAGDQMQLNFIRGDGETGFYLEQRSLPLAAKVQTQVYFPLEDQHFALTIDGSSPDRRPDGSFIPPPQRYQDGEAILAISDIESAYKTLRDFLQAHRVIDAKLNWTFGKGHLVLLGDMTDRGPSTTQVLWLIYQLEQAARAHGGTVHYILGNHEIKNLQGNFQAADKKYQFVATVLGKQQIDLYGENSLLGRWLASKNTAELINGKLFVHGGLHPKLATLNYSLEDLNHIVRAHYRTAYFPKKDAALSDLMLSTRDGPSWYRGYFEADLSQAEVERTLATFGASAVVVGHTPQRQVTSLFEAKVFAINVRQPRDYRGSIPPRSSEGLLIRDGQYFRLLDDGNAEAL